MKLKEKILLFLKGIAMGTCDIVPGVSGGSIAFITGIYDRLIDALHSFNMKAIQLLLKGEIKKLRKYIDGNFLVILFLGIFTAILVFANLLHYLLNNYPQQIWAVFFGLILASVFLIKNHIKKYSVGIILLILIGIYIGYIASNLTANQGSDNILTMIYSGSVAIIAMILPGISGSYILVILGQYHVLLGHISKLSTGSISHILPICYFMIGAIVGILFFAKILHRIKKHYHNEMVAILLGIMVGSLNKLRPRKTTITTYTDKNGQILPLKTANHLPTFTKETLIILLCFLGGISIIIISYFLGKKYKKKKPITIK